MTVYIGIDWSQDKHDVSGENSNVTNRAWHPGFLLLNFGV